MNRAVRALTWMFVVVGPVWAQTGDATAPSTAKPGAIPVQFEAPVRLTAGETQIQTEPPGYASPCWTDTDADGRADLVVGQFADGKVKVYRNLGNGKFAEGTWLRTKDGEVAELPGVW